MQFVDQKPQRSPEIADHTNISLPIITDSMWLEPSPFGLPVDMSFRDSQTPASDLKPRFMRNEQVLHNLKAMTKGKAAKDHHPAVQQVIVGSLKHYPELLSHYMNS